MFIPAANNTSSVATMAKLTDLPSEIHFSIVRNLMSDDPPSSKRYWQPKRAEQQDILHVAMLSDYWPDIAQVVVKQRLVVAQQGYESAADAWRSGRQIRYSHEYYDRINWHKFVEMLKKLLAIVEEL